MRQKEKKRVRDSVIALVLLLLLLSGCGCYIAFRYIEGVRAEYEEKLDANEELIYRNTRQAYVACREIRVGESVEAEMLEVRRALCSQDENILFTQQDIGKEAVMRIPEGTFLCKAMVNQVGETKGLREMCYQMIDLTENVDDYDMVDIRIRYPDGTDYIVLTGKRIRLDDLNRGNCYLCVNEEELLLMSAAMVDAAGNDGTSIYTSKYIEPALQKKSIVTYVPPHELVELIRESPNLLLTEKGEN